MRSCRLGREKCTSAAECSLCRTCSPSHRQRSHDTSPVDVGPILPTPHHVPQHVTFSCAVSDFSHLEVQISLVCTNLDGVSEIWGVTCHMPHSVTCHPTWQNVPSLNPSQTGQYLIYLPWMDRRLVNSWLHTVMVYLVVAVVTTSPSGGAYIGGGEGANVPKRWGIPPGCHCPGTHFCNVNAVTKVTLAFCCPFCVSKKDPRQY